MRRSSASCCYQVLVACVTNKKAYSVKMVVDSNRLQSDELRAYFKKSKSNCAVIPDFVGMEMLKGNIFAKIFKSLTVLSDYPAQVIVLKPTKKVTSLSGRLAGLQRRLVDERATDNFPKFIRDVKHAHAGDAIVSAQILLRGKRATEESDSLVNNMDILVKAIEVVKENYSKSERADILAGRHLSGELLERIKGRVVDISKHIFVSHLNLPIPANLRNTLVFRMSACSYLYALDRAAQGGVSGAARERLRNDQIDVMLAAYGTFFDGVMSADNRLIGTHKSALRLLAQIPE